MLGGRAEAPGGRKICKMMQINYTTRYSHHQREHTLKVITKNWLYSSQGLTTISLQLE